MRLDKCEQIGQFILDIIDACQFCGHLQIVSVVDFIGIIDLFIQ